MRKIVRLKYKDGESIVVHINTFMGLVKGESMVMGTISCVLDITN